MAGVVEADDTLRECGFEVLRELASVGYTGDAYHRSGFRRRTEMLAALWRESPVPRLAPASGWPRWPACCTATAAARWSPS